MRIRTSIAALATVLLATPSVAQTNDALTRVDYLDQSGLRYRSSYPNYYYGGSYVRDNEFLDDYYNPTYGIRFIAPGTQSYTAEVTTSDDNMTVSVVSGNSNPKIVCKEQTSLNFISGTVIKFRIVVPEGYAPAVKYRYQYTDPQSEDSEIWTGSAHGSSLATLPDLLHPIAYTSLDNTDMSYRKSIADIMSGTPEPFQKDPSEPNVWYANITMPNEPISIEFSKEKSEDPSYLRDSRDNILLGMYCQQSVAISPGQGNMAVGEAALMYYFGDNMSGDVVSNLECGELGREYMDQSILLKQNSNRVKYPWQHCYSQISAANLLLDNLDRFKSTVTDSERNRIKAELLTIRANAYIRILQIYGQRWQDSGNGATLCAPLELTYNTENVAPSSMKTIADQCYADLDWAINTFDNSGYTRKFLVEPDANVARGIKLRLASLRQDWNCVHTLATNILAGKPLSSSDEVLDGFFTQHDSWIWGAQESYSEDPGRFGSQLYYWGPKTIACNNGAYAITLQMGPSAIDKDLYASIPESDIRKKQFALDNASLSSTLRNYLCEENCHNSMMDFSKLFILPYNGVGDYVTASKAISRMLNASKPSGVETMPLYDGYNYAPVVYGSNLKFWRKHKGFGDEDFCFMRAEEILLSKAEACYNLGNETEARQLLTQLNSLRDNEYSCTATGSALFDEIRKYRRIELWGEGLAWFDTKRWKLPISRNIWSTDLNSGNWNYYYSEHPTIPVDANNGWRAVVPKYVVDQNPLIDVSKMGYSDLSGYQVQDKAPVDDALPAASPISNKASEPDMEQSPALTIIH